jgi:hypothetical protein
MLATSRVLAELIQGNLEGTAGPQTEIRLVVPALTRTIGKEVHSELFYKGIRSFLVIGDGDVPNQTDGWIRPIGLTSMRIGSFVAITMPGQLTHVQDSIRGSGGAIRSLAFSEEWPWIDTGAEPFRFDGPFLESLSESWCGTAKERDWIREVILDGLIDCTRASPIRAELLLERTLGSFEPSGYSSLKDVRSALLCHAGIPGPKGDLGDASTTIARVEKVIRRIGDRCKKDPDVRRVVRENAEDQFPGPVGGELVAALDTLLDGTGSRANMESGILAFNGCWGLGTDQQKNWGLLPLEVLEKLFEVQDRPTAKTSFSLVVARGIVSDDLRKIATFLGETIQIHVDYEIPQETLDLGPCEVVLANRRRVLFRASVTDTSGQLKINLDTEEAFANYSRALPLRLAVECDHREVASQRIELHLCGEQRPAFAVVSPPFEVAASSDSTSSEAEAKLVEVQDPVHIYLLDHSAADASFLDADQAEIPGMQTGMTGVWRTAQLLDPSEYASGQVDVRCIAGNLEAGISLRASNVEKGEFTLEDELRVVLCGKREKRLGQIVGLFAGDSRTPYPALGSVGGQSRRRIALARAMAGTGGWRPIVANITSVDGDTTGQLGPYLSYFGRVTGDIRIADEMPAEALNLLRRYADCRQALLSEVSSSLDGDRRSADHPLYATHPVFVQRRAVERERLLASYLETFLSILTYSAANRRNVSWAQLFSLTYLDCVVHWEEGDQSGSFLLIGPWHPVVLAKRYMVQRELYLRSVRFMSRQNNPALRQLTELLGRVQGFRWCLGLSLDDRQFEPLCVCTTSDPGWHFAYRLGSAREGIRSVVLQTTGLWLDLGTGVGKDLPRTAIRSFLRAFPSRRSVGIALAKGYAPDEAIGNIEALVHGEDGPTIMGRQLPGGVRIHLGEEMSNELAVRWSNPPVSVFRSEGVVTDVSASSPDIAVLPPLMEPVLLRGVEKKHLPRGRDLGAVFSWPLRVLAEGRSLVSRSISYEFDSDEPDKEGLGAVFVKTLCYWAQMFGDVVATAGLIELPRKLSSVWVAVPGQSVDPAVLVEYVRGGGGVEGHERALWDYRVDLSGVGNSYYVLSVVPTSFRVAVNGFFGSANVAEGFISELGEIGIAVGGEALRSGKHALGILGLVGAAKLLMGKTGVGPSPLRVAGRRQGFLISVDAFAGYFGQTDPEGGKRTDLLGVMVGVPELDDGEYELSAIGVESKFVSTTYPSAKAITAMLQGVATAREFRSLVAASKSEGGMAERLALLELLSFGLRVTSSGESAVGGDRGLLEASIYGAVLQGRYHYRELACSAVVVSTEGALPGVAEARPLSGGLWIRLTRGHWPDIAETASVGAVRAALKRALGSVSEGPVPNQNESPTSDQTQLPETGIEGKEVQHEDSTTGNDHAHAAPSPAEPHGADVALRRILIGVDDGRSLVYYDPQSNVETLDNLHIMVTGSSGKGKTHLLKYLIAKLREQEKPVLVIDFKNDFASDERFSSMSGLSRIFVAFDGLPYNPLIPYPVRHPATGELYFQPGQHIAGVVSVLKRTYRLGDQQAAALKNAIAAAFEEAGLPTTGTVAVENGGEFPDFRSVGDVLLRENERAFNRLEPLFSLDLFPSESRAKSFYELTSKAMIIDLSQIPSDDIKNALAQMLVMSAHAYFNSLPHSGSIRQICVFDEAHRVLDYEFMAAFILQCRAYGVGMVLSSQYPSQFPQDISSSMATKIIHGNERDSERIRDIVQLIGCVGREGDVASLERFQAFLDNRHYPQTLIRTISWPLYLALLRLLRTGSASVAELSEVDGLDVSRLPLSSMLRQLELLGLVTEAGGMVQLVDPSGATWR